MVDKGYETIKKKGRYRPKYPPSVFERIPQSIIPNRPPNARQTKRTSNHERNTFPDELSEFSEYDRVTFSILQDNVLSNKRHFCVPITSFVNDSSLYLQSLSYVNGTPSFLIIISESLKFDVNSLSKNQINTVHRWSTLEEAIRFLNFKELNNKVAVMIEQMAAMSATPACTKNYDADIIVRAFEYFSTCRSLYNRLRVDYQSPSIQTLTRLTSKVSKLSEANFLQRVLNSIERNQTDCVVFFDEVYVKQTMLYHGGTVFGKACNNPSLLANTVLGTMINCMFGGPTFLTRMLNAEFLAEQINETIISIKTAGGTINSLICDNNRTNQKFFKSFPTALNKPWVSTDGLFLLFDYVHIIKNIRNNWLTEKSGELIFDDNGTQKTAKWSHLVKLYQLESGSLVKLSKLNEVVIEPKPVERQSVASCLRVFSDETGLLNHPGMKDK